MTKARLLAATLLLALAACNRSQPDRQVAAGGEILPGSVSDAMLPLDAATSAPPPAPKADKGPVVDAASEAPAVGEAAAAGEAVPAKVD